MIAAVKEKWSAAYAGQNPTRISGAVGSSEVFVRGNSDLLLGSAIGVLASTSVPVSLILPALRLARQLAASGIPVASGFQAPLERDFLEILNLAGGKFILCPSRRNTAWPPRLMGAVDRKRGVEVLGCDLQLRSDRRSAIERNKLVVGLSTSLFLPAATSRGRVYGAALEAHNAGIPVWCYDHPSNYDLMMAGARPVDPGIDPSLLVSSLTAP